jgi:predicted nucleic acid-binding protein
MKRGRPVYYWDACIFIAWLNNEDRPAGEMEGLASVADMIDRDEAVLIVSQAVRPELLPSKLPPLAEEMLASLFKRRNAKMLPISSAVTARAQKIRDWDPKIATPDAIHLATAIVYEADEFHTFDEGKKKGRSLLSLNGNVDGYPLVIKKPLADQLRLPGMS